MEGRETSHTLNLTTGSYGRITATSEGASTGSVHDDEEFQGENPMRESQVHESKTRSSTRTPNPVAAISTDAPSSNQL